MWYAGSWVITTLLDLLETPIMEKSQIGIFMEWDTFIAMEKRVPSLNAALLFITSRPAPVVLGLVWFARRHLQVKQIYKFID